jgi:SpoVK/Ycf46/Vps4 family AAA+-type ATPase
VADFAERVMGHVLIAGEMPLAALGGRSVRIVEDAAAGAGGVPAERWRRALGPERAARLGRSVARVAAQFRLAPAEIDAVCARAAAEIDAAADVDAAARILWHRAGRVSTAVPTPGVTVVEPAYGWRDIVLARPLEDKLKRLEAHVRHATEVLDEWGFAERMGGRGRGVAALFSGPSGTGKTMAAEVIASSLDLRMMLIDLSQIISKYVGETSKNIAAAFEQAERSGAVMVWNEGDAIWGSRGSVGNATDRHVNAEVGDLLQRIEAFRGFTIVTTNLKHAIDPAFLRRFRFTIDFEMPSEAERLRLWQRAFPDRAPVDEINWAALAGLPLSGGSIRNVALGSAFLAAERGSRIDRTLIAAELAEELRKHNLPVSGIDWERAR